MNINKSTARIIILISGWVFIIINNLKFSKIYLSMFAISEAKGNISLFVVSEWLFEMLIISLILVASTISIQYGLNYIHSSITTTGLLIIIPFVNSILLIWQLVVFNDFLLIVFVIIMGTASIIVLTYSI